MSTFGRWLGVSALGLVALGGLNLLARRAAARREDIDPAVTEVPGSFIDVGGRRVHYVEAGAGEPVLLIHGWNGSTFDMRYTIAELSRYYRVVAVDLLGYGFSARPADGDYSVGGLADFVRQFTEALYLERATVLGHSMGGAIAMQYALRYPERVERLVLVSSATPKEMLRARTFGLLVRPLMPLITLAFVRRGAVRRGLIGVVHDPALVTDDMLEGHFRPLRVQGHMRAQAKQLSDRRKDPPYDLREIRQPTLILWGEHDRVVPLSTGRELAEHIPNAQLAIIRSAGHLALEEQPEECNKLLQAFLSQAAPAPSTQSNGVARESASTLP
jgi:pimeloyl-ACP methyl ester carboxylesterase